MSWYKTTGIGIKGISAAVPVNKLDVGMLTQRFDPAVIHKFVKSTGIMSCHQARDNQTSSDLGYVAAKNLLDKLDIDIRDIGLLVFVSTSPDYRKPSTSCVLQKRLELSYDCACMDIVHGCAGFMYGHQTMTAMLASTNALYGLLILGETTSKVIDKNERNSMMFGDAGAAVLYERRADEESITLLKSDGNRYKSLIVPAGGFRDMHPKHEFFKAEDGELHSKYYLYMNGMDVFNFATTDVYESIKEYLFYVGKDAGDYDVFASHQANNYIIQRLAKKLRIPKEKVPICLDRYGNTSSVSIPLLLSDCFGNSVSGVKKILSSGFGIGLAWGVTSFTLDTRYVYPVIETEETFDEGVMN